MNEETYIPDAKYRLPALFSFLTLIIGTAVTACLLKCGFHNNALLRLMISLLPIQFFGLAAMLISLRPSWRNYGFKTTFNIPGKMPSLRECVLHIVITLAILYPAIALVTPPATWLCKTMGLPIIEQDFAILPPNASLLHIMLLVFSCTFLAPLTEELLMRLILYRTLRSYWQAGAPYLTAAIFAIFHGCPQYTPGLFLVGLALHLAQKKGGLPLSIILHAAFNAISLAMLN
ncbi:MAG: CPBP family intramembrane metalloprotease [Victivallales bacterium]|nr:CPBP family intramembrane metalloprotease [Victivallales bacterium]